MVNLSIIQACWQAIFQNTKIFQPVPHTGHIFCQVDGCIWCDQYPVKVPGRPGRISCQPGCRCRGMSAGCGAVMLAANGPWRQKREDYHRAAHLANARMCHRRLRPSLNMVCALVQRCVVIISHAGHDQSATRSHSRLKSSNN